MIYVYNFDYSYGDCEKIHFVNADNKKRAVDILNAKYDLHAKESDLTIIDLGEE